MARSATISISGEKAGRAVHAAVPPRMTKAEGAAFFPELVRVVGKATGHTGCFSGLPVFIFEEEVEDVVRVDLGKVAAGGRAAAGQ